MTMRPPTTETRIVLRTILSADMLKHGIIHRLQTHTGSKSGSECGSCPSVCEVSSEVFCELHSHEDKRGRSSRELRKAFPHLKEWRNKSLWAPSCFHGYGQVIDGRLRERYIQNQEKPNAKSLCTGSVLKSGVGDWVFKKFGWISLKMYPSTN